MHYAYTALFAPFLHRFLKAWKDLKPNAATGCAEELHPNGEEHYLVAVTKVTAAAGLGCGSPGRPGTQPCYRCPEEHAINNCSLGDEKGHKKPAEVAISHSFQSADGTYGAL